MRLEIGNFIESGNLEKERLILIAKEDVDIGNYVVLRSRRGNTGNPISGSKSAYWLPDVELKAGDIVALYSKDGSPRKKTLESGKKVHFYYWKLKKPIWGDGSENTAVLLEIGKWSHKSPVV
ncbi:hypothetical protein ACVWZ5_000167 [Pseudomonas sp. TE6283]